jgi:hypothetical protein
VRERSRSERYTSQVGLVSTLRDDLQQLGGLLKDLEGKRRGPVVERIVLYIDDLDRCQPVQVVEVLQAVHLLLAFPLFHVVVGVDPRWLSRSLRRRYVRGEVDGGAFDPHEYLEKIFQIPYTLPEMTRTGFEQLVGSLVRTRSEARRRRAARSAADKQNPPAALRLHAADPAPAVAPVSPPAVSSKSPAQLASIQAAAPPKPEPVVAASVHDESSDGLFLEDFEERFLCTLFEFMDRPRLIKRFLNLYRLIRLRAAEVESEFDAFAGSPSAAGYRAAAVLLAVNVGHARLGHRLLQAVLSGPAQLPDRENGKSGSLTWTDLFDNPPYGLIRDPERDQVELGAIRRKLESIGVPEGLDAYKPWAEAVIAFSFQWDPMRGREPGRARAERVEGDALAD